MQKRLHLLVALLAFMVSTAMAQITTSGISGKVTANGEDIIGETITTFAFRPPHDQEIYILGLRHYLTDVR